MEELISKSLIEILVKSKDKKFDIKTLLDDTEPTMDNYSFALVTLITESVRRNWSEQDLKDYLVQVIPDQNEDIVNSILERYVAHRVRKNLFHFHEIFYSLVFPLGYHRKNTGSNHHQKSKIGQLQMESVS